MTVTDNRPSHVIVDSHCDDAGSVQDHQASQRSTDDQSESAGLVQDFRTGQSAADSQGLRAGSEQTTRTGQALTENQKIGVGAGSNSAAAIAATISNRRPLLPPDPPGSHDPPESQAASAAGGSDSADPAIDASKSSGPPPGSAGKQGPQAMADPKSRESVLADPILALLADVLDDLERTRIANENRLRQLTRTETDKDGEERGFGLDESHPDVARLAGMVDALRRLEHEATLNLGRAMRRHPLGPWVKAQKGIGEKQAARLLATIGDPYWHTAEDRPRLVSELWQFAGHGDPSRSKRRKGQRVSYSPLAKMRLYLVAVSCMKQKPGERYRDVYEQRRTVTAERVHAEACVRCGPSGKPALPGTPWSKAHQLGDALRIVGKEILRDLWLEARQLHQTTRADQTTTDTQRSSVGAGDIAEEGI